MALRRETFPECLRCSDQVKFQLALSAVHAVTHAFFPSNASQLVRSIHRDENTKRRESRSPNGPFAICATCCRGTIAAGLGLLPSHEHQAHRTVVLPRTRAVRVN